jgi:hypothetical protein
MMSGRIKRPLGDLFGLQSFGVNHVTLPAGQVDEAKRAKNRSKSKIRARVEHVFAVVKRLWGFTKVRYRGLAKNASRAFTALALANLYLSRHRLVAAVRPGWANRAAKPTAKPARATINGLKLTFLPKPAAQTHVIRK